MLGGNYDACVALSTLWIETLPHPIRNPVVSKVGRDTAAIRDCAPLRMFCRPVKSIAAWNREMPLHRILMSQLRALPRCSKGCSSW